MTTDLDRLMAESDPLLGATERLDAAMSDIALLAEAVLLQPALAGRATRRKRVGRRTLVAVGVGAALVPGIAWAASSFLAETGVFGKPGMSENDTSQYINVCAKDFPAYFKTLPLPQADPPAGLTWGQVQTFLIKQIHTESAWACRNGGEVQQVTGLKAQYLSAAETVYECRAYRANARDDTAATIDNLHRAADTMDQLQTMGVWGDSNWIPWRDAAHAGNIAMMAQSWKANTIGAPTAEGMCR